MTIHCDKLWEWDSEALVWQHEDGERAIRFDPPSALWQLEAPNWSGKYASLDVAYQLAAAAEGVYRDGHDDGYEAGSESGYEQGYDEGYEDGRADGFESARDGSEEGR